MAPLHGGLSNGLPSRRQLTEAHLPGESYFKPQRELAIVFTTADSCGIRQLLC